MVDTFVVLTDNETWAGNIKPVQALQSYRETHNPNAKLVVVGMTSTGFSIADPNDSGMLDVVGFDANILPIISEFTRG
jgi:60 kDa SS-A/Ro ribonucleoprotein